MKVAGKVAKYLVHKRNRQSLFVRWTKAEYCIGPFLVHAPYLAVREIGWGWFDLGLGDKGFRSRVSNDAIRAPKTDLSSHPAQAPHKRPCRYGFVDMNESVRPVANPWE